MTGSLSLATCGLCLCFFPSTFSGEQPVANNLEAGAKTGGMPEFVVAQLGQPTFRLPDAVQQIACSPDGKLLAARSMNGHGVVWDRQTGKVLHRFQIASTILSNLAFSPDSKFLAYFRQEISPPLPINPNALLGQLVVLDYREIVIWSLADDTSTVLTAPELNADSWAILALAPGGKTLAIYNSEQILLIRPQPNHQKKVDHWKVDPPGSYLGFSADGQRLLSAASAKTLLVQEWNVADGKLIKEWLPPNDPPFEGHWSLFTFAPATKFFVALEGWKGKVRVWNAAAGKELPPLPPARWGFQGHPAVSPDGRYVAVYALKDAANEKTSLEIILVWNLQTGKHQELTKPMSANTYNPNCLCFSADGSTLFTGYHDGLIRPRNIKAEVEGKDPEGHTEKITAVAYSPDSKYLVSAGLDRALCKWDVKTGKLLFTVATGTEIHDVAYAPDGKTFAAGGTDKIVRLYQALDGKELRQFKGHKQPIREVVFSPKGTVLASRDTDQELKLWDLSPAKEIQPLKEVDPADLNTALSNIAAVVATTAANGSAANPPESPVGPQGKGLVFSPDGKYLFTTSSLNLVVTITVRDVAIGKDIRTLQSDGLVNQLAVSPDGRTLALANGSSTAWLFETATGKIKAKLAGIPGPYQSPHQSPNYLVPGLPGVKANSLGVGFSSNAAFGIGINGNFCGGGAGFTGGIGFCGTGSGTGGGSGFNGNGFGTGGGFCGGGSGSGFSFTGTFNPNFGNFTGTFNTPNLPTPIYHTQPGSFGGTTVIIPNVVNEIVLQNTVNAGHQVPISALTFSASGKYVVTGGQDGSILLWNALTTRVLLRVGDHQGPITCLACSPDGKTLASAGLDSTIILWDMTRLSGAAKKAASAERLWEDLAGTSAGQVLQAVKDLTSQPDAALALLKQKLKPAQVPSPQIQKWLADLNSKHFPTRTKAAQELEKLAEVIEPALQELLSNPPSLEVHLRVQAILKKLPPDGASSSRLQQVRALEVLEQLETPQALALLQALAQGSPEAWLTREAQKSVSRLKE